MWTWKQINKNRHISLEKYMTTSILLTFKLHHWKYKFSNTSASFMVRSSLANYSKTKGKRGCENRRRLLKFIMKIKSNTTNKDLYLDVSVSIRGLRQKKMALALIIIEFRIIEITTTLRLSENQRIWYKFSGFVFSCLLASAACTLAFPRSCGSSREQYGEGRTAPSTFNAHQMYTGQVDSSYTETRRAGADLADQRTDDGRPS